MKTKTITLSTLAVFLIAISIVAFVPSAQALTTTFGDQTKETTSDAISHIRGTQFSPTKTGIATSMNVYVDWDPTFSFGVSTPSSFKTTINNMIVGRVYSLTASGNAQSITAYLAITGTSTKTVRAAIYNAAGTTLLAQTTPRTFTTPSTGLQTFTFLTPPNLAAGNYLLVVWASASGTDDVTVYRHPTLASGNTVNQASTYSTSTFPSPLTLSIGNGAQWAISCNIENTPVNIKAAIYDSNQAFYANTEEKTLTTSTHGWVNLAFTNPVAVAASTRYTLAAWTSASIINANLYYKFNVAVSSFASSQSYGPTWPSTLVADNNYRQYSIYANVNYEITIDTCDVTGQTKNTFNPTEQVYLKGTNGATSTTYPVYIVSDETSWTDGKQIPSAIPGTTTQVTTDASGNIATTIGWTNPSPGKYDVVLDINKNGVYDVGTDALLNDIVTTGGFFVVPEYALGGLAALAACFMGFIAFKKRSSIPSFKRQ